MEYLIKINDCFKLKKVIEKLILQQIELPVNISYDLYNLYKELDNIERFFFERLGIVFNASYIDFNKLTDNQTIIVNTILESKVKIDTNVNIFKWLVKNENVKLAIDDVGIICAIFDLANK